MFAQIEAIARPQMRAYFSDLEIDKQSIERHPGVPFLHGTRETGTAILMMHPANAETWPAKGAQVPYLFGYATREEILRNYTDTVRAYNKSAAHSWLFFNGHKLRMISAAQAESIATNYRDAVLKDWSSSLI